MCFGTMEFSKKYIASEKKLICRERFIFMKISYKTSNSFLQLIFLQYISGIEGVFQNKKQLKSGEGKKH